MSDATPTPEASVSEVNSGAEVTTETFRNTQAAQAEAPKEPEFKPIKLKLKLDKREEEREFDQESLTRTVQKGLVADRRFEEAARKEQEVRKLMQDLQENYTKLTDKQARKMALEQLGINPVELAEELMLEYLEEQSLTAEQKRIRELEAFQKQKQQEEEELLQQFKKQQEEKQLREEYKVIDQEISESLNKYGIAKNLETVERILQYLRAAEQNGVKISVDEVVDRLDKSGKAFARSFYEGKKGDELLDALGEDVALEVNRAYLKRRTGGKPPVQAVSNRQVEEKPIDPYLFFKNLGK